MRRRCQKGLVLKSEIPPDFPLLITDADKITKISLNLVDNAVKFTEKGAVIVSVRELPKENRFEFRVVDTGIGIPGEKFPLIFDLFYQIDSSSTRRYDGLGLGLYLVKKNTSLLGGNVKVESEVGRGSTFSVTLPIRAEGPQPKR